MTIRRSYRRRRHRPNGGCGGEDVPIAVSATGRGKARKVERVGGVRTECVVRPHLYLCQPLPMISVVMALVVALMMALMMMMVVRLGARMRTTSMRTWRTWREAG